MMNKTLPRGFLLFAALSLILFLAVPPAKGLDLPNDIQPTDCNYNHTITDKVDYILSEVYRIPVVVHVISNTSGDGDLTDQQVVDQIQVLNEDFRALALDSSGTDTMIQFSLVRITRTVNDTWYNDDNDGYLSALGWDQARFLNIYTNSVGGDEGRVNDPFTYAGLFQDGVTLAWYWVGGRDQNNGWANRNQGRNAVYFVGMYLGLYETYREGCREVGDTPSDSGDLIPDTPAQYEAILDCPETPADSCGDGTDPIHNFMNSTPDECRTEFTSDQANRMVCVLLNYRPGLYKPEYYGLPILNGPLMPLLNFP